MNGNEKQEFKGFDLRKRQTHAFSACKDNTLLANETIKSSQNWLLALGLAEMSFLGAVILRGNTHSINYIKFLIVILLLAFIMFIIASICQFKHLLKKARAYQQISSLALEKYLHKGTIFVKQIPDDLEVSQNKIISSKVTNFLFSSSYTLVVLVTIGIIFLVIAV